MFSLRFKPAADALPLYAHLRGLALWGLVPLVLLSCVTVGVSIMHLGRDRSAEAQRWAEHLASEADADFKRRLEGLRTLAALTASARPAVSVDDWYRSVQTYDHDFDMPVMLVSPARKILRHSRWPAGSTLPDLPAHRGRPAFDQALETGQAQIGDPVWGPVLREPVVQIILPLTAQRQVLMGLVPTEAFRDLLLEAALPEGWHASLRDSLGREIASSRSFDEGEPESSDRRAQASLTSAPFSVAIEARPGTFYKESLFLGSILLFALAVSLALIAQGTRRASLRLVTAVARLAGPAGTAPVGVPRIQEIETVQQALQASREVDRLRSEREGFLLQLGDALRSLGDPGSVQEEVCRLLAGFMAADRVFYAEIEEEAGVLRVVRQVSRGAALAGAYPLESLQWAVGPLRAGQCLAIADLSSAEGLSEGDRAQGAALAMQAFLGAPLFQNGRLVAALCVTQATARAWAQGEGLLVQEVADRLWVSSSRALALVTLSARTVELTAQTRQLRWLASELTLAEHKTRELLSKALHDHLQQILFGTSLTLQRAITKFSGDPILEQARLGLKEAMEAARSLSLDISPPVLRREGLPSALQWLATQTHQKYGLAVEVSADPQADPRAFDVRVLLFECVRELLFNAVKHAKATRVRIVMTVEAGPWIQIELVDDGVGFDPRKVVKSGGEVLGLGLFSIRERLHLLGGEMRIDSAPGQGARFVLRAPDPPDQSAESSPWVPASEGAETGSTTDPMAPVSGTALRILLVDDHAMVRDGLRQLIASQPRLDVVGEAVDGVDAVVKARALHPDVVVMDRSMPGLDGVGATRRILAELPRTVILGMSMDEGDAPRQFEEAGAAAFFSKKDGAELLLQRLEFERLSQGQRADLETRPKENPEVPAGN